MYNTSSYTINSDFIDFKDKIKNLKTNLTNVATNYKNEISNMDESLKRIVNNQNDEDSSRYLQMIYEPRKLEIEENLMSNISNLLKELYTIFETSTKNIFTNHKINVGNKNHFNIDLYYQYLKNEMGLEINNDFKKKFVSFKSLRNTLTHEGVNMRFNSDEIINNINDMTKEFESIIVKIITEFNKKINNTYE